RPDIGEGPLIGTAEEHEIRDVGELFLHRNAAPLAEQVDLQQVDVAVEEAIAPPEILAAPFPSLVGRGEDLDRGHEVAVLGIANLDRHVRHRGAHHGGHPEGWYDGFHDLEAGPGRLLAVDGNVRIVLPDQDALTLGALSHEAARLEGDISREDLRVQLPDEDRGELSVHAHPQRTLEIRVHPRKWRRHDLTPV